MLAVAVGIYTQIGTLGLGLAPSVALLLASLPLFVFGGAAIRRLTHAEATEHTGYPFQLALPSLAFYCAFFVVPMCFLLLFSVATPLGFGGVEYGFDLGNFEAGAGPALRRRVPAHAAHRRRRDAADHPRRLSAHLLDRALRARRTAAGCSWR